MARNQSIKNYSSFRGCGIYARETTHFQLTTNTNIQMPIKQHCGALKLNAEYLHLYANPNST